MRSVLATSGRVSGKPYAPRLLSYPNLETPTVAGRESGGKSSCHREQAFPTPVAPAQPFLADLSLRQEHLRHLRLSHEV